MNTFLFDLDGTLLPMDQEEFIRLYMTALAKRFQKKYDVQTLISTIWAGTRAMADNDGSDTNENVFWQCAAEMMNLNKADCEEEFLDFYQTDFSEARGATAARPEIIACIHRLKRKGYTIVAATNPFFPKIATQNRLRWAGFDPDDFDDITTYENSSFCKPNLNYYKELLKRLGRQPSDCVMVGNDNQEDMCAEMLGIRGYLITDCLINRNNAPITCHWHGSFDDFAALKL